MSGKPWHTDRWFVSPWNYLPEATRGFQFAERVQIHDLTLRDGEQQSGFCFRSDEKVRIAARLAELGVHRIEAGTPAVSKDDEKAVREIAKHNFGPKIFALARCRVEDVKQVVDCGADGAIVEIPCSEHMLEHAYGWSLERAIEMSVNATRYAKEQGLYVVFFPIDATRTEATWYLDLIEQVASHGGMDALALVDTTGSLAPHAVPYMVQKTRERLPGVPLECHFHNDFGLGAANTLAALAAGVDVAHLTVTGIGERGGSAPLEDVAVSLLTMYGVDLGIKYEQLTAISQLIRELSPLQIPNNRQIVGDDVFDMESGIITDWYRNCRHDHVLEVFPFHWGLVGGKPPRVVLGKKSGRASISLRLEEMGITATPEQTMDILLNVKDKSIEKKGLLTDEEFEKIVQSVLG
jgi:isopropylmalate/homocitrate/citramalate synthase